MPHVPGRELLSFEYVPQVTAASGALDLGPNSVGVGNPFHAAGNFLVEAWPAAPGIELVLGLVEDRAAALAGIPAGAEDRLVLPGERGLGSLVDDDPLLRAIQFPPAGFFGHRWTDCPHLLGVDGAVRAASKFHRVRGHDRSRDADLAFAGGSVADVRHLAGQPSNLSATNALSEGGARIVRTHVRL